MASSTTVPISSTVSELWGVERDNGNARALRLAIRNEVCTLLGQDSKTGSVSDDFAAQGSSVPKDMACYVLFREDGSHWIFITYIPECCTVREKTLYASALSSLRRDLGEKYFTSNARLSSAAEFDWNKFKADQKPVECLNEREIHFKQLDEMEETARHEMEEAAIEKAREKQAQKKAAAAAGGAAPKSPRPMPTPPKKAGEAHAPAPKPAAPAEKAPEAHAPAAKPAPAPAANKPAASKPAPAAAASKPAPSPVKHTATTPVKPKMYGGGGSDEFEHSSTSVSALRHAFEDPSELSNVRYEGVSESRSSYSSANSEFGNADALGGYHTVTLPFSDECQDAFEQLKRGDINTMTMRIEDETVVLVKAATVPTSAIPEEMDEVEPRFLLHKTKGSVAAAGVESERTLFVYCCPDKSQPKWRMVYSTSKPSIVDEAENHGITVHGKMEIRSGSELTSAAVAEAVRPRRSGAGYGYVRNSKTVNHAADSAVSTPHPVYSKIGQNRTGSGPMKHIVLPPSSAY